MAGLTEAGMMGGCLPSVWAQRDTHPLHPAGENEDKVLATGHGKPRENSRPSLPGGDRNQAHPLWWFRSSSLWFSKTEGS